MQRITQLVLGIAIGLSTAAIAADTVDTQSTYADIEHAFGAVPSFIRVFPAEGVAGAWMEMKSLELNPHTALSGKQKELIGLAVAAQIPCHYCVYFHTAAAKANGATDDEVREAIAMAAVTRHWSTVLNGSQIDMDTFKRETDAALKYAGEQAAKAKAAPAKKP